MVLQKSAAAVIVAATVGLGTLSLEVHAQNAPSDSGQTAQNLREDMAARVKRASFRTRLERHSYRRFDGEGKSGDAGLCDLRGDLQKAVKAANKTAGGKNVVNELIIQPNDEVNVNSGQRAGCLTLPAAPRRLARGLRVDPLRPDVVATSMQRQCVPSPRDVLPSAEVPQQLGAARLPHHGEVIEPQLLKAAPEAPAVLHFSRDE
jgi:hypothetical protein